MPKKKRDTRKRLTRAARAKILAEMNSKGLTVKQVAKRYGINPWTVYGWRKRGVKKEPASKAKPASAAKGRTKRATSNRPAKRGPYNRKSAASRSKILAEMVAKKMTAKQVSKKYGVSPWTIYGWRQRTGVAKPHGRKPGRPAKGSGSSSTGISAGVLREEIRAVLPAILREELARAIAGMVGGGGTQTRRRTRAGKK